jgi:alkanesulfonate monooxygenase SsuD/methylene tetrahydromethanopterin reductase-like flavin-dependent oxidoreductase (luciferase family)
MQFVLFNLMPWPYMPDDFEQKHKSAWLTYPNSFFDAKLGHDLYKTYIDHLVAGERLGFDAIGVNEHHQNAYGLMPSPNIIAAMLVQRTSKVKILVLGNALPLYDHPQRVAEEFAMLDVISGGRLIAGLVVGLGVEAYTYEINPTMFRERYREAHDLIVRAWTEPGPFHFDGKHYNFRWVNPWPLPMQKPHPPIWVPGSGSVETIRWVAEHQYPFTAVPFSPFDVMKEHFDLLREYSSTTLGRKVPPSHVGWPALIHVADTDAQAREEVEPAFWYLARKGLRLPKEYMFPPGHTSVESLTRVAGPKRKYMNTLSTWDEVDEGRFVVYGSPATVRDRMKDSIKAAGCGIVTCIFQIGNLPPEKTMKSMELFASEVMPALRKEIPW